MIQDNDWHVLLKPETHDDWVKYRKAIYPYFHHCAGQRVLEIAPFCGTHTQIIQSYNPNKVTLVELNSYGVLMLKKTYPEYEVIKSDIFDYLLEDREFDVVVCCGLLYHLHSPFYLLELIVNKINPEYLYLETYVAAPGVDASLVIENDNLYGNRHTTPGYKSTGISFVFSEEIMNIALANLGYERIITDNNLPKPTGVPTFGVYKRI